MADRTYHRDTHCPVEVADPKTGEAEPCSRPTEGWAWYDGGEHEPMLMQACVLHETDGAYQIADLATERDDLRAKVAAVEELAALWELAAMPPEQRLGPGYAAERLRHTLEADQ